MLQSDFKEKEQGIIEIDSEPDVISVFLDFLALKETDESKITKVATEVFLLADMYKIKCLGKYCVPYIVGSLSRHNCIDVFVMGHLYKNEVMLNAAFKVLRANKDMILNSEKWKKVIENNPMLINELLLRSL